MQKDPIKTDRISHLLKSIHIHSVQDREDGGETEADEHACSKWSPKRGAELWIHGYSSAADANGRDLCPIVQISLVVGLRFIPTYHSPVGSL